ncbi:hypothetical protein ES707_15071 [subsurface metagenome]
MQTFINKLQYHLFFFREFIPAVVLCHQRNEAAFVDVRDIVGVAHL